MSGKLKITRGSGNVFLDLGFGKDKAESLKLRADLLMRIDCYVELYITAKSRRSPSTRSKCRAALAAVLTRP